MCWTALDAALEIAKLIDADSVAVTRWRDAREAVRAVILDRGYDDQLGAFVQAFDAKDLDASTLVIPIVGFFRGPTRGFARRSILSSTNLPIRDNSSTATGEATDSRVTKARFCSARFGSRTRSRSPVMSSARAPCSNARSRAATTSVYSPKRSMRRRERPSETFRKRSVTSA